MTSEAYEKLKSQTLELKNNLLDFSFKAEGDYSTLELTKAAAYTVFSHAEIEDYFEYLAINTVMLAETLWRESKRPCKTLISICIFLGERPNPPQQRPDGDIWQEPIYNCLQQAKGMIRSNNGIRPSNINPFLALIGFDIRQINSDLLSELDTLGSIRGHYAHNSLASPPGQVFDPFDRQQKVESIVELILEFDETFENFKRSQFDPDFRPAQTNSLFSKVKALFGFH